jgi:hypothetical protein
MGTDGVLSTGLKRPGREADRSPPASAEVQETCMHTPPPLPVRLNGLAINCLSTGTTLPLDYYFLMPSIQFIVFHANTCCVDHSAWESDRCTLKITVSLDVAQFPIHGVTCQKTVIFVLATMKTWSHIACCLLKCGIHACPAICLSCLLFLIQDCFCILSLIIRAIYVYLVTWRMHQNYCSRNKNLWRMNHFGERVGKNVKQKVLFIGNQDWEGG